jgi:hypothetical protein
MIIGGGGRVGVGMAVGDVKVGIGVGGIDAGVGVIPSQPTKIKSDTMNKLIFRDRIVSPNVPIQRAYQCPNYSTTYL